MTHFPTEADTSTPHSAHHPVAPGDGGSIGKSERVGGGDGAELTPTIETESKPVDIETESGYKSTEVKRDGLVEKGSRSVDDTQSKRTTKHRPPPLATPPAMPPTTPTMGHDSLSRVSSTESPTSPFFIPRNPFLHVAGRIPRFQWASVHVQLLDDLIKSLLKIVEKWSSEKKYVCTKTFAGENITFREKTFPNIGKISRESFRG